MTVSLRVLITGCSSGFGGLIARRLAREGHQVVATLRDPHGRGAVAREALLAWAAAEGCALTVAGLDVTVEAEAEAVVAEMVARLGGIDVVIHNAGVAAAGLNETFSAGAMQRMFDVNVFGVQRVNRAVLPVMRGQGAGHVVYMGSVLGREVTPFLGLYAATKHALEAMAESYRYDLSLLGIDSTVVQPGTFPTTAILRNLVSADDPARAAGYGPVAAMPGAFFGGLQAMVESGAAPDPAAVAEAVLTVISAPAGQRAARFVVDPSGFDGAARVNATSDRVQSEMLARFGLSALLGATTA